LESLIRLMKTAVVLTIAILAQATGNMYLSKGMKHLAAASSLSDHPLLGMAWGALGSPLICLGTLLLIVFFFLFTAALSWEDLSFVLPATSFGYVLNVAFAYYFLSETVSVTRWVGTGFISLGVLLVARSGLRAPDRAAEPQGMSSEAGR
jgi:drug/metabolite transporter (DMT)-like permease